MSGRSRSLETRVGVFVVLAAAVLVGFVLLLGNFRFTSGHVLHLDFPDLGGLRPGAKVKVAGMRAGKVTDIEFLAGEVTDDRGRPAYVRVSLEMEKELAVAVRAGSKFLITSEGLLGERYVEIVPGPPGGEQIASGTVVSGEPPVELQTLTARMGEMLRQMEETLEGEGTGLTSIIDATRQTAEGGRQVVDTLNKEMPELLDRAGDTFARLDDLAERLDWLIATGQEALDGPGGARDALAYAGDAARELDLRLPAVIDDTEDLIGRTKAAVDEARGSLDRLERELTATTGRARSLMGKAESVLAGVDAGQLNADLHSLSVEMTDTVQETRRTLAGILAQATEVLARVGELAAAVKEGKGTLGALLMDRELYDDIRELVLDLKSNPWKVLWKP